MKFKKIRESKFWMIILSLIALAAIVLYVIRVYNVNKNALLPEYQVYSQTEQVEYKGINYGIQSATMMNYNEFFKKNPQYVDYSIPDDGERKVIVVEYSAELVDDGARLETYIPIKYLYVFNSFDPMLFDDMNPSLANGSFKSGDTFTIVYEIYKNNLSEKEWKNIENTEYRLIFGAYPVRKEIVLSDINRM